MQRALVLLQPVRDHAGCAVCPILKGQHERRCFRCSMNCSPPRAIAERSRAGGGFEAAVPWHRSSGAGARRRRGTGATLATSRGGLQLLYSGVKLPLAMVATMLLVVPAFHAIAAAGITGDDRITLAAAGRGAGAGRPRR